MNNKGVILEGTRVRGLAILNSNQPVQLLIASDQAMDVSQTRRKQLVWSSYRSQGQHHTTAHPPEFDRLVFTGDALVQLDQQLLGNKPAPLKQTLKTLGKNPRLAWLAQLSKQNNIQWQAVATAHRGWDHQSQGLTPLAAAVTAVAVGCAIAGYGSTLVGSLVNNRGNIKKTLKELGSKEHLQRLAAATLTAALTQRT